LSYEVRRKRYSLVTKQWESKKGRGHLAIRAISTGNENAIVEIFVQIITIQLYISESGRRSELYILFIVTVSPAARHEEYDRIHNLI